MLSIITVSYNSADTITKMMDSITDNCKVEFEHILQDGQSSDDTTEIVAGYNFTKILSERDSGIYSALNKAIARACGSHILILHSDDFLASAESLSKVVNAFQDNQSLDVIYTDISMTSRSPVTRSWSPGLIKKQLPAFGKVPPHTGLIVRKDVYDRIGGFNEEFSISSDWDWMLRLFKDETIFCAYLPCEVVTMNMGGASSHFIASFFEDFKIARQYYRFPFFVVVVKKMSKMFQIQIF